MRVVWNTDVDAKMSIFRAENITINGQVSECHCGDKRKGSVELGQ
jgi:hypothetical protein